MLTRFYLPYGRADPSTRARVYHWLTRAGAPLDSSSYEVVVGGRELSSQPRVLRAAFSSAPDTSVVLRHWSPYTRGFLEQAVLGRARMGVYELDDGLPWDDGTLPHARSWRRRALSKSSLATRAAAAADRIIAGNDVLADWASELCSDVVVIPTCVEPSDYRQKLSYEIGGPAVIGWIGTKATESHLWSVREALVNCHRRTGARLHLVSAAGCQVPTELAGFTTVTTWTERVAVELLHEWDLGIMPLPDGPYERAKCGYKLLQYAAAGLPFIGSPVGVSATIIERSGAPGPRSTAEWSDALVDMIEAGSNARRSVASAGHLVVQREYSYAAWESSWRRAVGLAGAHGT